MKLNHYRLYSSREITTLMRSLTFVFVVCKQRNGVYAESTLVLFCPVVQTGIHTLVERLLDKPATRVRSTQPGQGDNHFFSSATLVPNSHHLAHVSRHNIHIHINQHMRYRFFSQCRATKPRASLRICANSPERSLLACIHKVRI